MWRWENKFVKPVLFFHHVAPGVELRSSGLCVKLYEPLSHLVNNVANTLHFSVPNRGVVIISCAFHVCVCTYHVLMTVMFNISLRDYFHLCIFFGKCLLVYLATLKTKV